MCIRICITPSLHSTDLQLQLICIALSRPSLPQNDMNRIDCAIDKSHPTHVVLSVDRRGLDILPLILQHLPLRAGPGRVSGR